MKKIMSIVSKSCLIVLLCCSMIVNLTKDSNVTRAADSGNISFQALSSNVVIFQQDFTISSTGTASVSAYLIAENCTSVRLDATLQKYTAGFWTNIKTWSKTTSGSSGGVSGTYAVSTGYYRVVTKNYMYNGSTLVDQYTYTSAVKSYLP